MGAYLFSVTGHLVIALNALLLGGCFTILIEVLNLEPTSIPVAEIFYDSFFFWILLFIGIPIITMRAFALESTRGTLDALLATPASEGAIVIGKWAACVSFFILTWVPWIGCIAVIYLLPDAPPPFHLMQWVTTSLGIVLTGSFLISLGCLFSALSPNQVVCSMATLGVSLILFSVSFLDRWTNPNESVWAGLLAQTGMVNHMSDFVRGIIDTRPIIFYISATCFILYLTTNVLQRRRWAS